MSPLLVVTSTLNNNCNYEWYVCFEEYLNRLKSMVECLAISETEVTV